MLSSWRSGSCYYYIIDREFNSVFVWILRTMDIVDSEANLKLN